MDSLNKTKFKAGDTVRLKHNLFNHLTEKSYKLYATDDTFCYLSKKDFEVGSGYYHWRFELFRPFMDKYIERMKSYV
jgi:hypothetical protein